MKKIVKNTLFLSACGIAALVVCWGLAYLVVGNEYILPSPIQTAEEMGRLFANGGVYAAFFATLWRAFLAFLIAFVFGVTFSVIAYLYPAFEAFLSGIIALLRALPTMAVLLLILLGTSHAYAPVVVGVLTLFPMLYTSSLTALSGVDGDLIEMSKIYHVPTWQRVRRLYLPSVFPALAGEGVAALSFSLKLIVSAEVLAFTYQSMGGLIQEANLAAEAALAMALTLLVCVVGVLLESVGLFLLGGCRKKDALRKR